MEPIAFQKRGRGRMEGGMEGQSWSGGKTDSMPRKVLTHTLLCGFLEKMLAGPFCDFTALFEKKSV